MPATESRPTLQAFVEWLSARTPEEFDLSRVARRMAAVEVADSDLEAHQLFLEDHHARSLIHATGDYELILLCWRPGQATAIHDHDGQRGWVRVLKGTLEETPYRLAEGSRPPREGEVKVAMEALPSTRVPAGPVVATVDEQRAFHAIENPAELAEDAISLHLYARPHRSCLVWEPETRTCRRKRLAYDRLSAG